MDMYRLYDKRKCREMDGQDMKLADSICKLIAIIILGTVLMLSYGCGIDQLWCYELVKAKAGNENVVRVDRGNDAAEYIIIDNDGNVRRLFYSGFLVAEKPILRSDTILFTIEELDDTKIIKRLRFDFKD